MSITKENKGEIPLSVIIPVYNRADQLEHCLDAMQNQNSHPQIILVDDHSTENLLDLCKKYESLLDLTYIRLNENSGPAKARNIGIANASYEFVAFTDSDCIPSVDWAFKLFTNINRSPHYVAGVGGRVLACNNDLFSRYMIYHQILEPHPRGYPYSDQYLYLVTANCVYRKSLIQAIGGFDEEIKYPGGEDVGLGLKLIHKNYQLKMVDDIYVYHDFQMNLKSFWQTFKNYGKGSQHQVWKIFIP
jgi:glycosyltransferase involved in cell wall biosynthesis